MDLYQILGLTKEASPEEIKKAYKKLAQKHRPDKNGGKDEDFKKVSNAAEILLDKDKRGLYDSHGISSSAEENEFQEALRAYQTIVQGVLAGFNEEAQDLKECLISYLVSTNSSLSMNASRVEVEIKKLEAIKARIDCSSEAGDFTIGVVDSQLDSRRAELQSINAALRIQKHLERIVEGLKYEKPLTPEPQPLGTRFVFTSRPI